MCRVLIYLGQQETPIYDLLYGPDNSLAHQSYAPQLMHHIQNLAGLGFCAWSSNSYNDSEPFYYKTTQLPFFDKNLHRLSKKISASCFLGHVRGVAYSTEETVSEQNVHPFKLDNTQLALAHNGTLEHISIMKQVLTQRIKPDVFSQIRGTTDSEWIYALFLSQLRDYTADVSLDEAWESLIETLRILREVRQLCKIELASPVNLFVTNGKYLIVTRFVYDFGRNTRQVQKAFLEYHSLWVTFGEQYGVYDGVYKMHGFNKRNNILFASEPLTNDRTTWIELPEYSITKAWIENGEVIFRTHDLLV
ncbi:glutamine amidotransferase [Legionella quinlivanii]|uniref:Glutamine amidotransferase n=1 Tax=Legionella quinlivanii TaxID=45073 RepID=A0A0W0Y4H2_9GAMM|nr:class II glutamine amidotransferase [Legionella quinlivanii]KTD51832.1 glutamine amidotransferase [Legionella quinlivanii]MCW8452092.1 class II glutamine amidotransferase [Legionella quinlivanii]SEF82335.1 glutamine amidotransferase [Legionella quinlivanii DSM 21216]STY09707.1 putative glutamine amidotransferase [Legionella quinlivanii]